MDFDLSKPQKLLQETARTFFGRECPPERLRSLMASETAYDAELWTALADQGWTGLTLPESCGGLGLGLVELSTVAEEMGRVCLPGPFLSTLWAAALIQQAGNAEQRKKYLDPIAGGELRATVALLESSGDWNPSAVRTNAMRSSGHFQLEGKKELVSDAATADILICVARSGDQIVLLPCPRGEKGITITPTPGMDATRKLYTVDFNGVQVPEASALDQGTSPGQSLVASLAVATVALCAEMVGVMQWILETTVEYAKTRQQFGKPIGIYQAVQHQCADMLVMTESARSTVYYAAWTTTENDPSASRAVALAKAYCSDAVREVGNLGVQLHGGIGFTWEHDMHLYYRRAKAAEFLFGDANYHREVLAGLILDNNGN